MNQTSTGRFAISTMLILVAAVLFFYGTGYPSAAQAASRSPAAGGYSHAPRQHPDPQQKPDDLKTVQDPTKELSHRNAAIINVNGTISTDTTWTSDNVYVVDSDLTIAAGATLTINAGTVVKLASVGIDIFVNGRLEANGTAASQVAFTSYQDDTRGGDTNGDGTASTPAAGNWNTIQFNAGSSGVFTYAFVGYGGYVGSMITSYSSAVTLDYVTLQASSNAGLYAENASVSVTNSQISNNGGYGLHYAGLDASVPLNVSANVFTATGSRAGLLNGMAAGTTATFSGNSTSDGKSGFSMRGIMEGSITWGSPALPIVIEQDVTIAASATLTLAAGAVVKFESVGRDLFVDGTLQANGTSADPADQVSFTSYQDDTRGGDTNNDTTATTPAAGNWNTIQFNAGSSGVFTYAFVGYGGYVGSMITSYSSAVTLDHVTLQASGNAGLYAENASVSVTNSQISNNGGYGLNYAGLDASVPLNVSANVFTSTGGRAGLLNGMAAGTSVTFNQNSAAGGTSGFSMRGIMEGDITWGSPALPIVIEQDVTIAAGTTLDLAAGTTVKFASAGVDLFVDGNLQAPGIAGAEIAFTSYQDDTRGGDTNNDGANTTPAAGDWGTIQFNAGSAGAFTHAFIAYGGYTTNRMLTSYSSVVTLDYVTLQASNYDGLYAENASVSVTNSQISNNGGYGLHYAGLDANVPLDVSGNVFTAAGDRAGLLENVPADILVTFDGNSSTNGTSGFGIRGLIESDFIWSSPVLPLIITGDTTIGADASLLLDPGTEVKFASAGVDLFVDGLLEANGTSDAANERIAFTSYADDVNGGDTNNDGANTTPAAGNWGTIQFNPGSVGAFTHAFIAYGGYGGSPGMITSYSSDVVLDAVTLQESSNNGLYTESASVSVINSEILNHGGYGLNYNGLEAGVPLDVSGNVFTVRGDTSNSIIAGQVAEVPPGTTATFTDNSTTDGKGGFRLNDLVEGEIVWESPDLPIFIISDVTIGEDGSLLLDPGTTVKLQSYSIFVDGTLQAVGTAHEPGEQITFTSYYDNERGGDTNNDGANTTPAAGNWGTIQFNPGSSGTFAYAFIGYGGRYYSSAMITSHSSDVLLDHVILQESRWYGLYAENASVSVLDSEVRSNGSYGLYYSGLDSSVPLSVTNTIFEATADRAGRIERTDSDTVATFEQNEMADDTGAFSLAGVHTGTLRWNSPDLPLLVYGYVTLTDTARLDLGAGSTVKFSGGNELMVYGSLYVNGTTSSPVVFTSDDDDEYGGDTYDDANTSVPTAGQWRRLWFQPESTIRMNHALVRYGGGWGWWWWNNLEGMISSESDDAILNHVTIQHSGHNGLSVRAGNLHLANSQVMQNNRAGMTVPLTGTVSVENTAIISNTYQGVQLNYGTMVMTNTTIADNDYGGIDQDGGTLTMNHLTIANNTNGSGIWTSDAVSTTLRNSIIAGNTVSDAPRDCQGVLDSGGNNVIGTVSGCTFNFWDGDMLGTTSRLIDPLLEPLTDNGGPSLTHALGDGSPAIDAGNNATCAATDQRGTPRPRTGANPCDSGAYEADAEVVRPDPPPEPPEVRSPDPITDTFDTDVGAWRTTGSGSTPYYVADGGNPGGHVCSSDYHGQRMYFEPPLDDLGDPLEAYGNFMVFDLMTINDPGSTDEEEVQAVTDDVVLVGEDISLSYNLGSDPGSAWSAYSVPLSEAGWINRETGMPATVTEMVLVLSSLQSLQIAGEYRSVDDTGCIDNFIFNTVEAPERPRPRINIERIGNFDTDGVSNGVQVVGDLAFIADGENGLQIVDVSDPTSPQFVGSFETEGSVEDVYVETVTAYIASEHGGRQGINIRNAYLASGKAGLQVVNVNNPSAPRLTGSTPVKGNAQQLEIVNNQAYVAAGAGGLNVVNVSNPVSPTTTRTVTTTGEARSVTITNGNAYVAADKGGVQIFDTSTPEQPTRSGRVAVNGALDLQVLNNFAYIMAGNNGMRIFDVEQTRRPVALGKFNTSGPARGINLQRSNARQQTGNSLQQEGEEEVITLAYIASGEGGVEVVDVTAPVKPSRITSYDTDGDSLGLLVQDDLVYVADGESGLQILSNEVDVSQISSDNILFLPVVQS